VKVKDEDVIGTIEPIELVRLGVELLGKSALGTQLPLIKLVERALVCRAVLVSKNVMRNEAQVKLVEV